MDSNIVLNSLRQEITEHSLQLKAIIQDINSCTDSMSELQNLNSMGRTKISGLRKFIDKFGEIAKEGKDQSLLKEVMLQREQLSSAMDSFRKSNIKSMLAIERGAKEELLKPVTEETAIRQRHNRDKQSMAKMSSNVTDQLLSISRQLAETTQRSADTLNSLVSSSDSVLGTHEELKTTSGTIDQSGKLLAKYGRREFTDKILIFFAFTFFVACVIYIVQKRLF